MKLPYETDEIAEAIMAAARNRGTRFDRLEVASDHRRRVWNVRARHALSGEWESAVFPFATARGIYTPTEIADRFTSGNWPFGEAPAR